AAQTLYEQLLAQGVDALLDDRGERPGAMFADWELIGVPLRVVFSDRGLKAGTIEIQGRRDTAAQTAPAGDILAEVLRRR
ncbi:MAG: proline--tRNA ligase, partial [Betaproteobacteria bacterium]|nr:proline--tRNA ligase [Betaproteobacteria bacterium]